MALEALDDGTGEAAEEGEAVVGAATVFGVSEADDELSGEAADGAAEGKENSWDRANSDTVAVEGLNTHIA